MKEQKQKTDLPKKKLKGKSSSNNKPAPNKIPFKGTPFYFTDVKIDPDTLI